ncbi:hypothetical protein ACFE04_019869 [Oxalis oulophora]
MSLTANRDRMKFTSHKLFSLTGNQTNKTCFVRPSTHSTPHSLDLLSLLGLHLPRLLSLFLHSVPQLARHLHSASRLNLLGTFTRHLPLLALHSLDITPQLHLASLRSASPPSTRHHASLHSASPETSSDTFIHSTCFA